jgi:hypothetical protein
MAFYRLWVITAMGYDRVDCSAVPGVGSETGEVQFNVVPDDAREFREVQFNDVPVGD